MKGLNKFKSWLTLEQAAKQLDGTWYERMNTEKCVNNADSPRQGDYDGRGNLSLITNFFY